MINCNIVVCCFGNVLVNVVGFYGNVLVYVVCCVLLW
jgi:hypothetical protein